MHACNTKAMKKKIVPKNKMHLPISGMKSTI